MDVNRRMREEWNRRASEDARFYAGFGRRQQDQAAFLAGAASTVAKFEQEFVRLPASPPASRRALEIGCGPGRLMLPLSRYFGEIHGVDISDEMVALARESLREVPNAHVQLTPGSGLPMFGDESFDFVYSYIVFQHIPDRAVVLEYLREAKRVLKKGGVLCCQLRGAPPLASEMERNSATWTGCFFTGEEIVRFAREHEFPLVALSGLETQYMWTTWVKGPAGGALLTYPADFSAFALKAVTATSNGESRIPARGPGAAVSLWIDGLPASCHLGNLEVRFNDAAQRGCYLSPVAPSGACQLNARLPEGFAPGPASVTLCYLGEPMGDTRLIEVTPPPARNPKVLSVTDGIAITSDRRIEMGGVKVTLEDVERPEEVSFELAGRPAEFLQFERKDPITDTYEFAFHLSHKTRRGKHLLAITVSGQNLPAEPVEVTGLSEPEAHRSDHGNGQHGSDAGPESDLPFGSSVKPQRKIARALARWLHHQ